MTQDRRTSIEVDDPFARRLLNRYIERRKNDLESLREALATRDYDKIRRTGHNLSGSGVAYGLEAVTTIGAGLEAAAAARQAERTGQLIDELEKFISNVSIV